MESSGTHKSYDAGDRVDTVLITCGPGTKPCHRITGCRRGLLQYLANLAEFKEITICSKQHLNLLHSSMEVITQGQNRSCQ